MASGASRSSSSKSHKPYDPNRRHQKARRSLTSDRAPHTSSINGKANGLGHLPRSASSTSSFSYVDHAMASSSRNGKARGGAGGLSMGSGNDDDDGEEEGAIAESDADEEGEIDDEHTQRGQRAASINGHANHASSSSNQLPSHPEQTQHRPQSPPPPRPPLDDNRSDLHRRLSDRVTSMLKDEEPSSKPSRRSSKEGSRNPSPPPGLNIRKDKGTHRSLVDRISISRAFDIDEPSGSSAKEASASSSKLSPPPTPKQRSNSRPSPLPASGSRSSLPARPPSPPPLHHRPNGHARHTAERERDGPDIWTPSDRRRSPSPPPYDRHRSSSNHWRDREPPPSHGGEHRRRDNGWGRDLGDDDDRGYRRSRSGRRSDRDERRSDRDRDRDLARSSSRRSGRDERDRSRSRSRSRSLSTERRRDDDRRERRYSRRDDERHERRRRRSPSTDVMQRDELDGGAAASYSSRRSFSERRRSQMDLDPPSRDDGNELQQQPSQPPPRTAASSSQGMSGPSTSAMLIAEAPARASEEMAKTVKPSAASTASVSASDGSIASVNGTPQSPMTTPASTTSSSTSAAGTGWKKVGAVAPSNAPSTAATGPLAGVPTGPRSMMAALSGPRSTTTTAPTAKPVAHAGGIPTGPRALQHGRKSSQQQQSRQLSSPHFLSSPIGAAASVSSPSASLQQPTSYSQPSSFAPVEPAAPPPSDPEAPPPPPPGPPPGPPPVQPSPAELPVPPPLSFGHTLLPTELPLEERKKGWKLSHDPELDGTKSKGKKASRKPADVESAVSDPRRHKATTLARLAQSHRKRAKELNTVVWAWDKHSTGPRPPPPPREIVVTGLSPLTTNRQLLDRFRLLGRIDKAELKMNPQTGQSMGIFWLRYAHDFDEDGARLESASNSGPGQKGNECAAEAVKLANGERLGATDKMAVQLDRQQAKYVETFKAELSKRMPAPKPPVAAVEATNAAAAAVSPAASSSAHPHKPSAPPASTPLHHLSKSSPLAAAAIARSPASSTSTPIADAYRRRETQLRTPLPPSSSRAPQHDDDAEVDADEEFGNRHRLLASSSSRRGGFNNQHSAGRGGGWSGGAGSARSRIPSGDGMRLNGASGGGVAADVDAASRAPIDTLEPTWKILSRLSILGTPYIFISRATVGDGLSASLIHSHFAIFSPRNVSADESGWYATFSGDDAAARCDKVLAGKPIHGFSVSFELKQAPTKDEVQAAKNAADAPSPVVAPGSSPQKARRGPFAANTVDDDLAQRQPPSWLDPASALEWHKRQTYADRKATRGWTQKELVDEARSTILRELSEGFLKDLKTRVVVPHVSDFLKEDAPGGMALKKAAEQHAAATAAAAKAAATAASTPSHGGEQADAEGKAAEPATTLPSFRKLRRTSPSPPPARRPSASTKAKPRNSATRKGGRVISDDEEEDEADEDEQEPVRPTRRPDSQAADQPRRQDADRTYGSASSGEEDESDGEGQKDKVRPPPSSGSVRDATEETAETAETALTTPTPEPTPASAAAAATAAAGKKSSKAGKKAAAKAAAASKKKQAASKKAAAAVVKEEEHAAAPSPLEEQATVEDVVMEDVKEQDEDADAAMAKLIAAAAAAPPSRKSKSAKASSATKGRASSSAPPRPRSPSPDPFAVGVAEEEEDLYFLKVALERLSAGESVTPDDLPEDMDGGEEGAAQLNEDGEYEEGGDVVEGGINFSAAHSSGSARTEGFYKIPPAQKAAHLPDRNKAIADTTTNVTLASARGNRADSRRVLLGIEQHHKSSLEGGDADSSAAATENHSDVLLKFNQLRSRKKQLKFAKSPIHDWGLYAMETIPAGDMVIEYVGEQVRQQVADHRERLYEKSGNFSTYLFRVDDDVVVDATHKGNIARLMNHCCVPNCNARILTLNGQKRIVLYAKTTILPGQELTYDYKFQATPDADDAIACLCGAEGCRRFL